MAVRRPRRVEHALAGVIITSDRGWIKVAAVRYPLRIVAVCRTSVISYPVYDSSCSIRLKTQSKSPLVTLPPQYSQIPAMLIASGAPQFGQ